MRFILAAIGFASLWRLFPAAGTGRDARPDDAHAGLFRTHPLHEGAEILEHLRGRAPVVDIVATDVQHDEARRIRNHQAVHEVDEIAELEGIDAAVDQRVTRQVLVDGFPAVELRIPGEQDGVMRRWRGAVRGLVLDHLPFELGRELGRLCPRLGRHPHARQGKQPPSTHVQNPASTARKISSASS